MLFFFASLAEILWLGWAGIALNEWCPSGIRPMQSGRLEAAQKSLSKIEGEISKRL